MLAVDFTAVDIVNCNLNLFQTFFQAHSIGGFSTCFSSGYVCRFCHCTHKDLSQNIHNFGDKVHTSWTMAEYDRISDRLEEDNWDIENDVQEVDLVQICRDYDESESDEAIEYDDDSDTDHASDSERDNCGVKSKCVFNKLKAFHCVTSMPVDCLHDLFEGVIAQDLLGIFRILKGKSWFDLESYNSALKNFSLSSQEASNQPQPVPTNNKVNKLVGKAVSIWCHMRFFLTIISIVTA